MNVVILGLLSLLTGLLVGFYARAVYIRVDALYREWRYQQDVKQAGVVPPTKTRVTKGQPVDNSSETGPVTRPSPDKVAYDAWRRDHPKQ